MEKIDLLVWSDAALDDARRLDVSGLRSVEISRAA
ncbi:MAG: hypothetical protein QOH52_3620, partial [Pseudonocardiales bacterium]|nr:hypothetical protein [Pseudonocardiales bacterium]